MQQASITYVAGSLRCSRQFKRCSKPSSLRDVRVSASSLRNAAGS